MKIQQMLIMIITLSLFSCSEDNYKEPQFLKRESHLRLNDEVCSNKTEYHCIIEVLDKEHNIICYWARNKYGGYIALSCLNLKDKTEASNDK